MARPIAPQALETVTWTIDKPTVFGGLEGVLSNQVSIRKQGPWQRTVQWSLCCGFFRTQTACGPAAGQGFPRDLIGLYWSGPALRAPAHPNHLREVSAPLVKKTVPTPKTAAKSTAARKTAKFTRGAAPRKAAKTVVKSGKPAKSGKLGKPGKTGKPSKLVKVAKLPAEPRESAKPSPKTPKLPAFTAGLRKQVIAALDELKARDIKEIDIREKASFTDLLVIASGTSTRHVKSIADEVVKFSKRAGVMPLGVEGQKEAEWVLVDLGDIVVHVMLPRIREFYGLERLWTVGDEEPAEALAAAY